MGRPSSALTIFSHENLKNSNGDGPKRIAKLNDGNNSEMDKDEIRFGERER